MSENLSEFLKRVMKQKGLTLRDVEQNCGRKITNSYVSRVINGKGQNLTLETIVALAEGFDVDPHEIFAAAYGKPPQNVAVDPLLLIEMLQKLASNPQLIKVIRGWMRLSAEEQLAMLQAIDRINERESAKRPREKRAIISSSDVK
jgi:transcriptional regulator with XRE-family HTH domain